MILLVIHRLTESKRSSSVPALTANQYVFFFFLGSSLAVLCFCHSTEEHVSLSLCWMVVRGELGELHEGT